jgi:hypothetical protein
VSDLTMAGLFGLVGVVAVFLAFVAYLVLCAYVVRQTGGTAGLRDVAVAVRAFSTLGNFRLRRT